MEPGKKRPRSQLPSIRPMKPEVVHEDFVPELPPDYDEEIQEEAEEQRPVIVSEEEKGESEPEEGEDLEENMEEDYKPIDALDRYEHAEADNEQYEPMTLEQRKEVNKVLNERDREEMINNKRIPAALYEFDEGSEDDGDQRLLLRERQRRRQREAEGDMMDDGGDMLDMEDIKGKLSEWIRQPRAQKWLKRNFDFFLRNYKDENGGLVYEGRIHQMCKDNKQGLEITYTHLAEKAPTMALWVAEQPALILPILDQVAFDVVTELYPQYASICKAIFVKIKDLPVEDKLRDLRQSNLRGLVKVKGVITKRTNVQPQLKHVTYECTVCGALRGPFYVEGSVDPRPGMCNVCQFSNKFRTYEQGTMYINYQRVTIQETPGTVPAGRVPRQKDVILLNDNIDVARPGDEVEITGIFSHHMDYAMNAKHGFPVFSTTIEANYVGRLGDIEVNELTEEDIAEIRALSKDKAISKRIFASIAPSIYGHPFIKKAIALAMFGGLPKDIAGKHKIRGDINVLLLGDPGTAKSQFLKYVEKAVHRCVYTTGKGASAVGLTAGVRHDPITKEWTLEGGALVLADQGMCLIDEFDKMNDQDRTSIHEAMEQQSISISKAGIVTSLHARCSVIAAANPIRGKYDAQKSFNENVDLTDPILSRFDILAVVKDEVDPQIDHALATFVINSHIKCHPKANAEALSNLLEEPMSTESTIPQDILKKYVLYAKRHIHPKLQDIDKEKISKFYTELRRESAAVGGLPIGVRHVESILRMAESHARMHLREHVVANDVNIAIEMMLKSFLMSQKYAISKALEKKFARYLVRQEEPNQLLLHVLEELKITKLKYLDAVQANVPGSVLIISKAEFESSAKQYQVHDYSEFYASKEFKSRYYIEGRYKPPVIYLLTEAVILGIITWRFEPFRDWQSPAFYAFWVISLITFVLYLVVACMSPGYVALRTFQENEGKNTQPQPNNIYSMDNLNTGRNQIANKKAFPEMHCTEGNDMEKDRNSRPRLTENNSCSICIENSFSFNNDLEYRNESGRGGLLAQVKRHKAAPAGFCTLMTPQLDKHKKGFERQYRTDVSRIERVSFLDESEAKQDSQVDPNNSLSADVSSCNARNATIDEKGNSEEVADMVLKHQFPCQDNNFASVTPASVRSTIAPMNEDQKEKKPDESPCAEIKEVKVEILPNDDIARQLESSSRAPEVDLGEEESKEDKQIQDVLSKAKENAKSSFDSIKYKYEENELDVPNNYCVPCKLVQPFRCKHCKVCDKCVATFDHHCLWMGNCIGEKNKRFFYLYLLFQLAHCAWTLASAIKGFSVSQDAEDWLLLAAGTVAAYFTAFLVILVTFHTFLCLNNLTTWEVLSWEKITYMAVWPPEYGSPFSQGLLSNLKLYWCMSGERRYMEWAMPKKLPEKKLKGIFFLQFRLFFKWLCD